MDSKVLSVFQFDEQALEKFFLDFIPQGVPRDPLSSPGGPIIAQTPFNPFLLHSLFTPLHVTMSQC